MNLKDHLLNEYQAHNKHLIETIKQLNEENSRLREALSEQSTTVHVIKRRNGKATIIGWNGERYVYQSESSARGGVRHGKPNKGQTFKT